jgi:RNA polymerase sigma factor (sigma-70 family)
MKPVEAELLDAACRGEASALDKLLAQVRPDLKRFARRSCSTAEDAEDAVQVALWKLHRHLGSLRALPALATWLFRVVERECFRLFRALRGRQSEDADIEAILQAAPVPTMLRHDLARAIAALPALYREVLILRDIEELSAPETAERLEISVAAVKMRLSRARGMMRARLMEGSYWSADAA